MFLVVHRCSWRVGVPVGVLVYAAIDLLGAVRAAPPACPYGRVRTIEAVVILDAFEDDYWPVKLRRRSTSVTCVVGLVDKDTVYIGSDSGAVSGSNLIVRADEKVFHNGPCLIGFTSSFRMGQLLRYKFTPPPRAPHTDLFSYMATDFVDAVRECLKSGGYARQENGMETGGDFLVAYGGRLFHIASDFQVGEAAGDYYVLGSGAQVALGALYVSEQMAPKRRVSTALEAAEKFSTEVHHPFKVLQLEEKAEEA
jgi:ATP-dependent protease HslVU (ClpYQ) peptidase subunit